MWILTNVKEILQFYQKINNIDNVLVNVLYINKYTLQPLINTNIYFY